MNTFISILLTAGCLLATMMWTGPANAASPVADAAENGNVDLVQNLLRAGADVNETHGDGMTALHWAAERGDADLAKILLYAGAGISGGTRAGGYTPLHIASRQGHIAVVEALLEAGADPSISTSQSGAYPHDRFVETTGVRPGRATSTACVLPQSAHGYRVWCVGCDSQSRRS